MGLDHIGIKEETCARWRYKVGNLEDGTPCHIMESRDDNGKLIGQKFRTKPRPRGKWRGNAKNPPLYGKWLWPAGGKYLTITEGEKDAHVHVAGERPQVCRGVPAERHRLRQAGHQARLRLHQLVREHRPDVRHGRAGQQAVEDALELLPAGKVKVAKLSHKDANDVLMADGAGELVRAFWNAETWRPDGIVDGSTFTRERVQKAASAGFPSVPEAARDDLGLRKGEITMLTAGSGIGKSTWARELAYDLTRGSRVLHRQRVPGREQ
jgi:twinkle protein